MKRRSLEERLVANSNAFSNGQKKPLPAPTDNDQYKFIYTRGL